MIPEYWKNLKSIYPYKSFHHNVLSNTKGPSRTREERLSPVFGNLKTTKQSMVPGIKPANHLDVMGVAVAHPIPAVATSKAGQAVIRESARFIDNALDLLSPIHSSTVHEPYTAVLIEDEKPKYIVNVTNEWVPVGFYDELIRKYLNYDFEVMSDDKIFQEQPCIGNMMMKLTRK